MRWKPPDVVAFTGSELCDNGYSIAQSGYFIHSPFARAVFQTAATSVDIDLHANFLASAAIKVQVWVNGLLYATPGLAEAEGAQTITQALPAGLKRVDIVGGGQSISTGTIRGTFLVGCTFNDTATPIPPEAPARVLVYGDSIACSPEAAEWPNLFRALSSRSMIVEAASGRQLRHDVPNATARAAFVAKLAAMKPATVIIAIGVNDYLAGLWDSSTFGTNYGLLLDDLHAALPNAAVYCVTPLMKHSERLNSPFARHLENYRQAVRDLVSTREWATLIEGPTILGLDDMESEGGLYLHPNAVGHRKYAEYIEAVLNGKVIYDQPPSFGTTENVGWTNTLNATVTGDTLTKTGGTNNAADAGGTSSQAIAAGPWWARFTVTETNKTRVFGVSSAAAGAYLADVLYGWAPQSTAVLQPWQEGAAYGYADTASVPGLTAGDQLLIRCDGAYVYYDRIRAGRQTTMRKASRPVQASDYPLYAKAVILGSGGTITDAKIHGPLG